MRSLPPDLVAALSTIRSLGVITGAGISAESGIQPYRGEGGLYEDEAAGDATVEALSARTLLADPDRTWRVVAELARRAVGAEPHAGHRALVAMEAALERFVLLTQNVDGLHARAGSANVIDIHGDVLDTRCMGCARRSRLTPETLAALHAAPRCDACGATVRPDAVLFGEMLPTDKIQRVHAELFEDVPDMVLIVGTTAVFPYIAEPVRLAAEAGLPTVEVNPEPSAVSGSVRWSLRQRAGEVLPAMAEVLTSRPRPAS